jgi:NCAIR mutase (PurE)-related protein
MSDVGESAGFTDLGFARVDTDRAARTGDPEVVYAAGKTPQQTVTLLTALHDAHPGRTVLATRADEATLAAVRTAFPESLIDEVSRCVAIGALVPAYGQVVVVSAGTSDQAVAGEAAFVARVFGSNVVRINDVGVAGLHRLLAVRDRLDAADCLVVVAGMEGALPSVVGGLVGVPVVAVPTSVGYGASFGGLAALLGMLNSCAAGVTVCNIDNGFGAGVFAARVARAVGRARESNPSSSTSQSSTQHGES